jgi:hypothetical protein
MMIGMLVSGIGLILAGLLAVGYGIQYKEFSVGSTLILAGVVGVCTGILMFGLLAAVRELRSIARRFGAGLGVEQAAAIGQPAVPAAPGDRGFLFSRDEAVVEGAATARAPSAATPPPWHEEAAFRDRGRGEAPPVAAPAAAEPAETPAAPKRRNLLFSSTSRKERERAQARASEPLTPDLLSPELRPSPPATPPASEASEPPPATFEDAWPKSERGRPSDTPPRRTTRTPSTFEAAGTPAPSPDREPPAPREEPQAPVTVLKSGVVDGMAYSLYSDGSIEAQMPEGMMRFASIDELRTHLDQRS